MSPKKADPSLQQDNADRNLLSDARKIFGGQHGQKSEPSLTEQLQPQLQGPPNISNLPQSHSIRSSFATKIEDLQSRVTKTWSGSDASAGSAGASIVPPEDRGHHSQNRFSSFAPERSENEVKWYVDGCSYMWAVSTALEQAAHSIWILDWWLSPELYLRRPPAKYEAYRIDRMLQAAATRGVHVNIIVYKEVTQALTLSSNHTKHALEDLHPNINVFRHPDHLPDAQALSSSFLTSVKNLTLNAAAISKLPGDAISAIYGMNEGTVLYWAHHEKLCLVDGSVAFMGGLDLCFGRWDTNQHAIADAHPGDLNKIVFPGQDYNNARIMDFHHVDHPEQTDLNRTISSRMGWSDLSLCLSGPAVDDLRLHFVQRWNYIYDDKYRSRSAEFGYKRLTIDEEHVSDKIRHKFVDKFENKLEKLEEKQTRAVGSSLRTKMLKKIEDEIEDKARRHDAEGINNESSEQQRHIPGADVSCQIMRSCTKWSHDCATEHSIQNAYIETIQASKHFIYIENQFFITATSTASKPVHNMIGAALVERILRAARAGEKFKVIVVMPAIPGFAGDLKAEGSLGTRAIMEFQYFSICRGGHSIMECIFKEGFDPKEYIRFYNLRNYDRLNSGAVMEEVERKSGVDYEEARRAQENHLGAGFGGKGTGTISTDGAAKLYQHEALKQNDNRGLASGRWDTVSECYMLGGEDIRNVPWVGRPEDELDAFVSEELYVHTKVLIADDRVVICGSANLNDRSQLGTHDSEIAIFVQPPLTVDSQMNGKPWKASIFAASLRRQLFRKHLGLLKPQDMERPDNNFLPVGVHNNYDWGSDEDKKVLDPLSEEFLQLWNQTAKINTSTFERLFHTVPTDAVKTWRDYDAYYEKFFSSDPNPGEKKPALYKWGHVVAEEFSPGEKGLKEVKDLLATIKGNLVEMSLDFLKEEDIAKEGVTLNPMTEVIYT